MPTKESSAGDLSTWLTVRVPAEIARLKARTKAAGVGPVALCAMGLLGLSGLCVLIVCATTTVVQMLFPWLAVLVVAIVAPPRTAVTSTARFQTSGRPCCGVRRHQA